MVMLLHTHVVGVYSSRGDSVDVETIGISIMA